MFNLLKKIPTVIKLEGGGGMALMALPLRKSFFRLPLLGKNSVVRDNNLLVLLQGSFSCLSKKKKRMHRLAQIKCRTYCSWASLICITPPKRYSCAGGPAYYVLHPQKGIPVPVGQLIMYYTPKKVLPFALF